MRRVVAFRCVFLIVLLPLVSHAQNVINTIVGGGNPLNGPTLTSASLGAPTSIVQGVDGSLYISSLDGEYVFKIDGQSNNISIFAGKGFSGFSGVGGPATSATLTAPSGLAIDSNGNLLIADSLNHHIYGVNLGTGILTNVAGSSSPASPFGGFGGDGGPATQALLNAPQGIVVVGTTIYFADSGNNRVRQIDAAGTITTIAGTGAACPPSIALCGDGGLATLATLNSPAGLGVGNTDIYVADAGDNRLRQIDINTGIITTIAGTGDACVNPGPGNCGDGGLATAATLNNPTAVIEGQVAGGGTVIYIADQFDQEIRAVDQGTQFISTVAGDGTIGFSGDGGVAVSASLSNPAGLFVDGAGNIFIADQGNNRIREVDGNGNINTTAGGGLGGDDGPALNAVFAQAEDVALDSSSNPFIIDLATGRIREVTNGVVTTVAGSGTLGFSGNGGPATAATLNFPRGVAIAPSGSIFIADTNNNGVRVVTNTVINAFAGTGAQCADPSLPCGDGGAAGQANLAAPGGVAVDAAGNVFIADTNDNRIRKVDNTANHIITTVAGAGPACPVSTNACGDGGPATLANLSLPFDVAVDGAGDIFIADTADNRIRKVDAKTHVITTVAFNGQATFSGDGGPATLASVDFPTKVVADSAGNLFISASFDQVVQRVDAASQTIVTVAGNAKQPLAFGFAGDSGLATDATLNTLGLAINATGGLYIADNNRIRFVQLSPISLLAPANIDFGNQAAGVGGTPVPVTLTNTGSNDLLISSIVDASSFSQTNDCPIAPTPLAPSQTCTINVTFTPTAAGAANDTLIITDNAAGSPHRVPLAGVGQAPFQLTTTCTTLSVVPGQSAIYTVDLAPFQGFTQSVSLSCSGSPALATCTVNPSAMALDGATTVQAKVTAATTAATSGSLKSPFGRTGGNRMAGLVGLAGMAGLAALVILPGKGRVKHGRRLCGLIFCMCLLASVATMSSCGVGGGNADPPGTAAGTYPLTVTATFKSATGTTFTQNVSFDLVVK